LTAKDEAIDSLTASFKKKEEEAIKNHADQVNSMKKEY